MILIAIGSNLDSDLYGFPLENCVNVINFLRKYFFVIKVSKFYETEPIPKSNQPWYVNGVVEIKTNLKPKDIIKKLFFIESHFGRIRKLRNEPRVIDLDLIDYSSKILNSKKIVIPHPRAHQRRFVMEPLAELKTDWVHPILRMDVNKILKKLKNQKINIIKDKKF